MPNTKDSVAPHAVVYQPTPTQLENDQAALGSLPPLKDYDGSPIDPSSNNPVLPAPPGAPVISTIAPTTGALPSAPFAITVHGSGFTAAAKVIFNQTAAATTFTSSSQIACSGITAPVGSYPLEVHDAGGYSNTVQFTITATTELLSENHAPPRRRPASKE